MLTMKTAVQYWQGIQQGFRMACTSPLAMFNRIRFRLTISFDTPVIMIVRR